MGKALNGKGKRGAPMKLANPRLRRSLIKSIALGMPMTHAARANRIAYQTLISFREKNPTFEQEIQQAQSKVIEHDLKVVARSTMSTDAVLALRASTWRLTHLPGVAEHFSENSRVQVTGDMVQQNVTILMWPHEQQQQQPEQKQVTNGNGNGNGNGDH